ncbi:hypothetical protein [Schaalia turicensis]
MADHVGGDLEDDAGLLSVCRAPVDLGGLLTVTARQQQRKADFAVAFIQALRHTKGRWAGTPFTLLGWQEQIVRDLFGTIKPDGYRHTNDLYVISGNTFYNMTKVFNRVKDLMSRMNSLISLLNQGWVKNINRGVNGTITWNYFSNTGLSSMSTTLS